MKKFYLFSFLSLGSFMVTHAQIVYTDINPDQTFAMDQMYLLDMDNDLAYDYIIEQTDSVVGGNPLEGVQLRHYPGTSNEAVYETTTLTFLSAITSGNVIDGTLLWTVPNPTLPAGGVITVGASSIPAGDWADQLDHYAGVRFTTGVNLYYGWIRFAVNATGTGFTMKDYAYHSTTDQPLLAGATVDGVEENSLTGFTMQQNGSALLINNTVSENNVLSIYDLSGKLVLTQTMNNHSQMIDLSNYENGIYILKCSNEKGEKSFKVSKYN